ncbi:glycosyltransferase family 2 protein [Ewingella sp. S1.OA.A_B6]
MHTELISIIVPAYCNAEKLERFLKGIIELDYPRNFLQLIIIDDCSPIDLESTFNEFKKECNNSHSLIFHRNSINLGRSKTRNIGIGYAEGRVLLFIDVDNILEKKALIGISDFFYEKNLTSARINIRINPSRLCSSQYMRYFDSRYLGARDVGQSLISTRFFASDGVAVTRDVIDSIGGFDESFYHYGCEDEELGMRIGEMGYPFYFLPNVKAEDSDTPTISRASARMVTYAHKSFPLLKEKHPECLRESIFGAYELLRISQKKSDRILLSILHAAPIKTFRMCLLKVCDFLDKKPFKIPAVIYKSLLAFSYIEGGRLRGSK